LKRHALGVASGTKELIDWS